MKLTELAIGKTARIETIADENLSSTLMEMGCVPGELIKMERYAPLGDPVIVLISGYHLSLRKSEAETIILTV